MKSRALIPAVATTAAYSAAGAALFIGFWARTGDAVPLVAGVIFAAFSLLGWGLAAYAIFFQKVNHNE